MKKKLPKFTQKSLSFHNIVTWKNVILFDGISVLVVQSLGKKKLSSSECRDSKQACAETFLQNFKLNFNISKC